MTDHLTALVVETNYLIASAIEAPLAQHGFTVVVATSDEEAYQVLASNRIQIAIIDFRLQHGGPDGLVKRLEAASIPYVFCTAASTEEVIEHFPGARVVEKPFGDDMLLLLVAELTNIPDFQNAAGVP